MTAEQTPKPQRRRQPRPKQARSPEGKFETGVEPTPVEQALPKKDYSIKPSIKPKGDAGKYTQKPKVRPTFGNVTSTSF